MTKEEMERVKRTVARKYPIFANQILLNIPVVEDKRIETAAVRAEENEKGELEPKLIKYNPEFMDNLSFEQQCFVLAHEICHVAFLHFLRSIHKPKQDAERKYAEYCSSVADEKLRKIKKIELENKYYKIWNIATDACINALLTKDGLVFPEGVIDKKTNQPMEFVKIEDGLYRSAEVIYDKLVKKEEEKEQNKDGNEQSDSNEIGGGLDGIDIDDYQGFDSHDEWVSAPENTKNDNSNSTEESDKDDDNKQTKEEANSTENGEELDDTEDKNNSDAGKKEEEKETTSSSIDETKAFEENKKARSQQTDKPLKDSLSNLTKEVQNPDITPSKPVIPWQHVLVRTNKEIRPMWSTRRASRYNPNPRIESRPVKERAVTEVVLDTSGSIEDVLLKNFLKQLLPLFKETEIKVGCFANDFYGFTELRTLKEVEQFKAVRKSSGTNFEAAATAFSKTNGSKKINKIVFTDGELGYAQRTRVDDIIWIVFGDRMDFKPLGGKIIRIQGEEYRRLLNMDNQQGIEKEENKKR